MPPKPNYSFEKRQRELEKKKKKAQKAHRKSDGGESDPQTDVQQGDTASVAPNAAPTDPAA